jgi:succinoglycan biosynthesis transport protein ExoP
MRLLRKHGVWLILATMAGLVGGLLVHAIRPANYLSTAQVDVEPHLVESLSPIVPNMGTEEQVAISGVVLDGPARQLHTTYRTLVKHLTATVTGSTATGSTATGTAEVLTIRCTMSTAVEAQRCAGAAASSYIAFRDREGDSAYARVHRPMVATLVTPATFPVAHAGPGLAILLPVGALLGLALGIGVMVARDHLDGRIRDRADLERWLDSPVLAAVPRAARQAPLSSATQIYRHLRERPDSLSARAPGRKPSLIFRGAPLSPAAEAYRYLRERLGPLLTQAPGQGAVLLIASAGADEGRTSVAANLSAAFAEAGATVILVDADLRHPSLSKIFSSEDRPGLADLLAEAATLQEVAVPVPDLPGVRVVTAGRLTRQSVSMLHHRQLTPVLQRMRAQADVVIVDSAPVLTASDGIALARASDIVAMVADIQHTGREAVSAAGQQIRAVRPPIIVGVLNGVSSLSSGDAWRPSAQAPQMLAAARASVSAASPVAIPLAGPNGHKREQASVGQAPQYDSADIGASMDGDTGSGQEPG